MQRSADDPSVCPQPLTRFARQLYNLETSLHITDAQYSVALSVYAHIVLRVAVRTHAVAVQLLHHLLVV